MAIPSVRRDNSVSSVEEDIDEEEYETLDLYQTGPTLKVCALLMLQKENGE
jgi:hypothetical protein